MIPLRDNVASRKFPLVTILLIVVNVLVFLSEVAIGPSANLMVLQFGIIPRRLLARWTDPWVALTLISSMYLHGGWAHLIGNMLYLWIFGDNVEDRMGSGRFFVFYTLCGVIAGLLQVAAAPLSTIPIIGASGAIAGVLGAYLLLFPRARIKTLIPLIFFYHVVWLPAVVVLGGWFLVQLFNGVAALSVTMQTGGVAWWAHIGGFVAGMILMPIFRRRQPPRPYDFGSDGFYGFRG